MSSSKYDVLVVGAGAAGLAAGRSLAGAGQRVAIVEARPRVGGRIYTQHFPAGNTGVPIPVELGAEFIHGLPRATWALTEEANLKTYELQGTPLRFAAGQLTSHGEQEDVSHDVLEEMTAWWVNHGARGSDMTFAEYLERNKVDAHRSESAANYVEGFNAADRTRIGIAGLAKQQRAEDAIDADRLFRITAGYSAIPTYMAEQFARSGGNLMLGKPVQSVVWKPGAVTVRFRDGAGEHFQLHADRAVISVPLGVLQAQSIEFVPRPAEILTQAHRLVMGEAVRVVLLFRTRFWSEDPSAAKRRKPGVELDHWSFLFTPTELPATWWTPMPDRTPMITAWAGGPKAAALLRSIVPGGDRHALKDRCLITLAKVFSLSVRELNMLLVSWHVHDWQADEYARGAYSYVPAGALDAPESMTLPVDDTLYFTGEHTDTTGHWGTVHAALAAGMFAARQILTADRHRDRP
jgi:monoamine oxidase